MLANIITVIKNKLVDASQLLELIKKESTIVNQSI